MIDVATVLDQRLTTGSDDGTGMKPCVMNAVHARWLLAHNVHTIQELTDLPPCTDVLIARFAQVVNDHLPEDRLVDLDEDLQVQLMLAHAPSDPMVTRRVRVRTLIWAARSVQHLVREQDRDACEAVISTAERWLAGTATVEECATAYAAAPTAYAATAYAAAPTAYAATAATAADAATAACATATAAADLVDWFRDLLTAHEKARAIEGVLHEVIDL